ncbi:P-loop containing nucleoside triphosphate hydrolase protein [Blastocladiella britannica]|nr:P-loop containing nucleoside triphosphate hydrolase protein [Blastocladiella britannica]
MPPPQIAQHAAYAARNMHPGSAAPMDTPSADTKAQKKKGAKPVFVNARKKRRDAEQQELELIAQRTTDPAALKGPAITDFTHLPISTKTVEGLKAAGFESMTDVQRAAIPLAICGRDVLGAAKTGSGKTLAFVIPILEALHRAHWSSDDGLGALILSPTRELAMQIFGVLREVGAQHSFSAGLIIGGKNLKQEKERMTRMNILVATPGRLLQHMDETPGFDANDLQVLVLDEADRILDMGFEATVNAIIDFLPKKRQTLLFSATQTKSVRDLARLSLSDAEYVAVHEQANPSSLSQAYIVAPLPDKLDLLWSFLKTHLQHKSIVFMSSCKQVRFVFEAFCKLKPGVPLRHLHGGQKQFQRIEVYEAFCRDDHAVLFTTDVAARGLDFPSVNWVVQLDAPDSAETYIHRAGRTARHTDGGNALLFLLPSEEKGMLELLQTKAPGLRAIKVNPAKTQSIQHHLQALCTQHVDLKYLAQRSFVTYIKSMWMQPNKAVFDVQGLPLDDYAEAIGLPGKPKLRFISKKQLKAAAAAEAASATLDQGDDSAASGTESDDNDSDGAAAPVRTKVDRMMGRRNQDVLSEHYSRLIERSDDEGDSGDDDGAKPSMDRERKPGAKSGRRGGLLDSSDDEDDNHVTKTRSVVAPAAATSGPVVAAGKSSKKDKKNKKKKDGSRPTGAELLGISMDDSVATHAGDEDDGVRRPGGDGFLTIRRNNHELSRAIDSMKLVPTEAPSHRRVLREREKIRKQLPASEKLVFDDEGTAHRVHSLEDERSFRARVDVDEAKQQFLLEQREQMKEVDVVDKAADKERRRAKRVEKKRKDKERRERGDLDEDDDASGDDGGYVVTLGSSRGNMKRARDDVSDHDNDAPDAKRLAMDEELAMQLLGTA